MAQAWEYSAVSAFDVSLRRMFPCGLVVRFASCPPLTLLLDLRKTHNQPTLFEVVSFALRKTSFLATGMVGLSQRNQGGARRAGDIREGRYAVADAGLVVHSFKSYQIKIDRK